jgi:hypothetical protein
MRLFCAFGANNITHYQRTKRTAQNQLELPMDKLNSCGDIQGNNKADDIG